MNDETMGTPARKRREPSGPHPDPLADAMADLSLRWRQVQEEYKIRGHVEYHGLKALQDAMVNAGVLHPGVAKL